jgi:hypothetical protein
VTNTATSFYGRCGLGTLTGMNRPQEQNGPTIRVRIQVSWRCRISGPAVARLVIVLVLVLAATAFALPAHDELARDALYSAAGLLVGARPRIRS